MSNVITKLYRFFTEPEYRYDRLKERGYYNNLSDKAYIKITYKAVVGHKANLKKPTLLTEKLNWLKLYNHNPLYTKMVDKYEVKQYVSDLIGEEYVVPCYGVWDNFDDIDFDSLPNQFVLKCTHDSGTVVVCKDKSNFDIAAAKSKIESRIQYNYYDNCREWPYKNVKPRIIADKFIEGLGDPESLEYKITCFNGKVNFITICRGIAHVELDKRTNNHFTPDFEEQRWTAFYKNADYKFEKPEEWEKMIEFSNKISTNIPYLRVDWFISNGHLYFGEATFFTWGGFIKFDPIETDARLGSLLELPTEKLI